MYSTTILCSVFLLCLSCLNVLNILLSFCLQLWGLSGAFGEQSVGDCFPWSPRCVFGMRQHSQHPDTTTPHDGCAGLPWPPWRIPRFLGGFCSALGVWHMKEQVRHDVCPARELLWARHLSPAAPTTPAQTLWQKERNCWGFFSQFGQPLNVLRETSCQGYFQFCRLLYPKLWSWHISEPS